MRHSRHTQSDLLLAKVLLRLQPVPVGRRMAAIAVLAGLVMVGVAWTIYCCCL